MRSNQLHVYISLIFCSKPTRFWSVLSSLSTNFKQFSAPCLIFVSVSPKSVHDFVPCLFIIQPALTLLHGDLHNSVFDQTLKIEPNPKQRGKTRLCQIKLQDTKNLCLVLICCEDVVSISVGIKNLLYLGTQTNFHKNVRVKWCVVLKNRFGVYHNKFLQPLPTLVRGHFRAVSLPKF